MKKIIAITIAFTLLMPQEALCLRPISHKLAKDEERMRAFRTIFHDVAKTFLPYDWAYERYTLNDYSISKLKSVTFLMSQFRNLHDEAKTSGYTEVIMEQAMALAKKAQTVLEPQRLVEIFDEFYSQLPMEARAGERKNTQDEHLLYSLNIIKNLLGELLPGHEQPIRPVKLNELIENVLAWEPKLQNCTQRDYQAGDIVLNTNEIALHRIFLNIFVNALSALLDLSRPLDEDVFIVKTSLEDNDRTVMVSFTDNAGGIPEHIIDKIFTPLFTTRPSGEGLGLSVVREKVTQLGGTVTVDSELGKGTTFTVRLPVNLKASSAGLEHIETITMSRIEVIKAAARFIDNAQAEKMKKRQTGRVFIGIEGVDGSGKSIFTAEELVPYLRSQGKKVAVVHGDWAEVERHIAQSGDPKYRIYRNWFKYDDRLSVWLKRLRESAPGIIHLDDLYSHESGLRNYSCDIEVDDETIILVEGLFLQESVIRELLDDVVYIYVSEKEAYQRQVGRDIKTKGRTEEQVRDLVWNIFFPGHRIYNMKIRPLEKAGLVIDMNRIDSPEIVTDRSCFSMTEDGIYYRTKHSSAGMDTKDKFLDLHIIEAAMSESAKRISMIGGTGVKIPPRLVGAFKYLQTNGKIAMEHISNEKMGQDIDMVLFYEADTEIPETNIVDKFLLELKEQLRLMGIFNLELSAVWDNWFLSISGKAKTATFPVSAYVFSSLNYKNLDHAFLEFTPYHDRWKIRDIEGDPRRIVKRYLSLAYYFEEPAVFEKWKDRFLACKTSADYHNLAAELAYYIDRINEIVASMDRDKILALRRRRLALEKTTPSFENKAHTVTMAIDAAA